MLTTEECLLSEVQQRNPGVSREQLEKAFADYLGVDQVIWLGRGIAGDDTHGHVDDIARFVGPETIVPRLSRTQATPIMRRWPKISSFSRLRARSPATIQRRRAADAAPGGFPRPAPAGKLCEFLHRQWLVLVPTFHDPNDRVALNILAEVFPDREVIGVHCVDLIWVWARCTA